MTHTEAQIEAAAKAMRELWWPNGNPKVGVSDPILLEAARAALAAAEEAGLPTAPVAEPYTPTTQNVRDCYRFAAETPLSNIMAAEQQFDRWLAAHDAEVAAKAWDEGAASRQCHCAAWSEGECACGNYPSDTNPYRARLSSGSEG